MAIPGPQDGTRTEPWLSPRVYWMALAFLLAVGFVLRILFIHWSRFAGDESMFFGEASAIVNLGWRPVLCANVSGGAARLPGGTFSYLMSVPLWIFRSPLAVMVWVALLNLGAVSLWTEAVRRRSGTLTGLVFAGLLLFNPWSFLYSDRIWNPNLMILLSGLLVWATVRVVEKPGSWQVLWIPLAVMAGPQFHLSGVLLLLLALVLYFGLKPRPLKKKAVAVGAGLGFLLYLPYLVHELQTGFKNSLALLSLPADAGFAWSRFYMPVLHQLFMAGGETGYLVAKGYWFSYDPWRFYFSQGGLGQTAGALSWPVSLLGLVALLAALVAWGRWLIRLGRKGRGAWSWLTEDPLRLGLLTAMLLPTLFMTVGRKSVHPHYLILFFPFGFLPMAWMAADWIKRSRRWMLLVSAGLCLLVANWIAAAVGLYHHGERRFSFPEHRAVMEAIEAEAHGKPFALEMRHRASRHSSSSFHELARHYTHRPFQEKRSAPLRFTWMDKEQGLRLLRMEHPRVAGRPVEKHWVLDASVLLMSRRRP